MYWDRAARHPGQQQIPQRKLSGWDDGPRGRRRYVLRNVDRVLKIFTEGRCHTILRRFGLEARNES
jgi:hypothetical protein